MVEVEKELTEEQKRKVGRLLSDNIRNKQHAHPSDLRRSAMILYRVNQLGYTSTDIKEILEKSGDRYSQDMIDWLQRMSDAFTNLMYGLDNYENVKLKDFTL
jgi:hypothetical protein